MHTIGILLIGKRTTQKVVAAALLLIGIVDLSACNAAVQDASQPVLATNVQGPGSNNSETASGELVEFSVLKCQHQDVANFERLLRPLLPRDEKVQLFSDPRQNVLYLRASRESQLIARQLLKNIDRPTDQDRISPRQLSDFEMPNRNVNDGPRIRPPFESSAVEPLLPQSDPSVLPKNTEKQTTRPPTTTRFVLVRKGALERVERQISAIFARNLEIKRIDGREILLVTLPKNRKQLELEFDRRRQGILVGGETSIVEQMARLCQAISENQGSAGKPDQRTKVFRVQASNHSQIRSLVRPDAESRTQKKGRQQQGRQPQGRQRPGSEGIDSSQPPTEPNRLDQGLHRRSTFQPTSTSTTGVVPAEFLYPDPQDEAPAIEKQDSPDENRQEQQAGPVPPLKQFEGVQIETMPDLDVIILTGRDQDLNQLEEIIKQIERISRETQPEIQIYLLKHTGSQSLADIIEQTQDELVGGRQGRVSITPLVKPNGLLLIGWGEAVKAVLEMVRRLDVPVDAETQFRVFRIRHAGADAINANIEDFFNDRGGLAPQVSTAVDARTNSVIVFASPRDMQEVSRLVTELDVAGGWAVNRTKIIPLRHSLANDVAQTLESAIQNASSDSRTAVMELQAFNEKGQQILRSGTLNNVQVTPNIRNNTLIVSSPKENLELIDELIRQLDSPATRSQLKVFKVYNSDASTMVETLRSLIPGSVTANANLKLPAAPDELSLAPLRFSVDVRSNSILATGSEGDLRIAEALILKLDESTTERRQTEVYQLKNSPAVDVANAVNQFLQSSRQIQNSAPGSQNPFTELEREVIVVPEPIANKLLLSATPRYFDEISQLIEKLDEQPPQVMIQVLIAEVALNDTDEFGIEMGLQDSVLFDRSLLGDLITTNNTTSTSTASGIVTATNEIIQAASNVPGFNFNSNQPLGNSGSTQALRGAGNVGGQSISNFAVGRSNDQLGFGGLVLSASSQNISVMLRALQETRRVDILSRPQIRTLDNQPAFIQVGQRVPRIIGSTVNQNGQSNSVTLENVGLILAVTPRIGPDGTVVMEVDAEKSNLGPEQDGVPVAVSTDGTVIRSPRVDTTTAQATVSAADGETIILGGLINKNTQQVSRGVPYLNRIPLLKNFFKYDGFQSQRSELMIILTPRVIRSAEDNARLRQVEIARMNWCAADVFEIHGEIDVVDGVSTEVLDARQPEVIYPVLNPRGESRSQSGELQIQTTLSPNASSRPSRQPIRAAAGKD